MKNETLRQPPKTPHERFEALGKKLLSVPRAKIKANERKWQRQQKKATQT